MSKIRDLRLRIKAWDEKRFKQTAEELGKATISRIPNLGAAYLYGSGAVKQKGYTSKSRSQLDIIVEPEKGVSIKKFALKLLMKNPEWSSISSWLSYALLPEKLLQPSSCIAYCLVNDRFVKLYITSNIEKYVLENGTRDISGRFSKKMLPLVESEQNKRNLKAKEQNQRNTLASALILMESVTPNLEEVGIGFNKLSYLGEFRNLFGMEKRDKAENSYRGEKEYYDSVIIKHPDLVRFNEEGKAKINYSKVIDVLCSGPVKLKQRVEKVFNPDENITDQLGEIRATVSNYHIWNNLSGSTQLAVKNLFTTGPVKSIIYVAGKARKAATSNLPYLRDKVLMKTKSPQEK